MEELLENLVSVLPIFIGIILVIVLILALHIKAPPNTAVIVSGLRKVPRVLIGQTKMRIPFLERIDRLSLKQMVMEVHTGRAVATRDYIDIQVTAIIKAKISEEPEALKKAAKHFLNQYSEDNMNELQTPLQAVLREVVGTKTLDDVVKNKETLAELIEKRAQESLDELGIQVLSCVIKSVEDDAGVLKALGVEKSTEIHKQATLVKAEADRKIAIETAKAKKDANDANVLAEVEITKKNQQLEIEKAQLKKEVDMKNMDIQLEVSEKANEVALRQGDLKTEEEKKRAITELAFEEETLKKRREIELEASMKALELETHQLKVKEKATEVAEQVLEIEVKRAAEAENYKQQQMANSNLYIAQKTAEAQKLQIETTNYIAEQEIKTAKSRSMVKKQEADILLYMKQQEAQAEKLNAETEAYVKQQMINVEKIAGLNEAEVMAAKGAATADGIRLKADAMKNYNQAAIIEMIVGAMPTVAKSIATSNENEATDVLETMVKMKDVMENMTGVVINDAHEEAPQAKEKENHPKK